MPANRPASQVASSEALPKALAVVKPLVQFGLVPLRLHKGSKKPIGDNWSEKPALSFDQLRRDYRPGENLGVRLGKWSKIQGKFLHCLDMDVRDPRYAEEAEAWIDKHFPEATTFPTVISGSGGRSRHFYFLSDEPLAGRKLAYSSAKFMGDDGRMHRVWEVELLGTGRQAVLPPSIHPDTGRQYAWVNEFEIEAGRLSSEPYIAADRFAALNDADHPRGHENTEPLGLAEAEMREILSQLPEDSWRDDRDGWLRVGMALHHETGGSEEGFALWDEFSKGSDKYDAKDQRRVWKSFREKARPTRMATLQGAAREAQLEAEVFEDYGDEPSMASAGMFDDLLGESEQTTPPEPTGFTFESAALWIDEPPLRDWLVRDLIPGKTVTLLGGDGGTGKSLLALQAAIAVASNRKWIGRAIERAGASMLLSAEDDRDELRRRFADVCRAEGLTPSELASLFILSLAGRNSVLAALNAQTNVLRPTPRYAALNAAMRFHRPRLLVLDTLADLHSGNQNDQQHARQFIGLLRRLAIRHDCAIVLLAHPSATGISSGSGLSGSMAWNNSVRSRLYFERIKDAEGKEEDTNLRVLRTMKANYGPIGDTIEVQWRDGVFVAGDGFDDLGPEDENETPCEKARRVFLRLLDLTGAQGIRVSPNLSNTYAPTVFEKMDRKIREGADKRDLERAMRSLLADNTIRIENYGPKSKSAQRLRRNTE